MQFDIEESKVEEEDNELGSSQEVFAGIRNNSYPNKEEEEKLLADDLYLDELQSEYCLQHSQDAKVSNPKLKADFYQKMFDNIAF